jgi:hypothetical protein
LIEDEYIKTVYLGPAMGSHASEKWDITVRNIEILILATKTYVFLKTFKFVIF